jgi:hypothetical protein
MDAQLRSIPNSHERITGLGSSFSARAQSRYCGSCGSLSTEALFQTKLREIMRFEHFFCWAVITFALGCTHSVFDTKNRASSSQVAQLEEAEADLAAGKPAEALVKFVEFRKKNLSSPFGVRALFGEAEALEQIEKASESLVIYRQIIDLSRTTNPENLAYAFFRAGLVLETLGEEVMAQAHFLDAERLKDYLPGTVRLAELPARLAALLARQQQWESSRNYLVSADRGLAQIFGTGELSQDQREQKAKVLLMMGKLSPQLIDHKNYQSLGEIFSTLQIFLLRSLEISETQSGKQAGHQLKQVYQKFWDLTVNPPTPLEIDPLAARTQMRQQRGKMATQLVEMIEKINQYKSPLGLNTEVREMYGFLQVLREQAEIKIQEAAEVNPLTKSRARTN